MANTQFRFDFDFTIQKRIYLAFFVSSRLKSNNLDPNTKVYFDLFLLPSTVRKSSVCYDNIKKIEDFNSIS